MEQAQQREKKWTYIVDGETYDVSKLPGQSQQAFKLKVEANTDLQQLNKQQAIHTAALTQLRSVIENSLTEEALIEDDELVSDAESEGSNDN